MFHNFKYVFFCILISGLQLFYSQSDNALKKEAEELFSKKQYDLAKPKFEKLWKNEPDNINFTYKYYKNK